jgi:hypothetical protein
MKNKGCNTIKLSEPCQLSPDLFLRRRHVQSDIIKKMLAEIELSSETENDLEPDDMMQYLNFDFDDNEDQKLPFSIE